MMDVGELLWWKNILKTWWFTNIDTLIPGLILNYILYLQDKKFN